MKDLIIIVFIPTYFMICYLFSVFHSTLIVPSLTFFQSTYFFFTLQYCLYYCEPPQKKIFLAFQDIHA